MEIGVVGQVLDAVLGMIGGVVWLQRHAVVAHSVGAMFAQSSMPARNLSILGAPVLVDWVLFRDFPRSSTCGKSLWGWGSRC